MIKIKKVCKTCGSEDLLFDSWARWDEDTQQFLHEETLSFVFCKNCDGDVNCIDVGELSTSEKIKQVTESLNRLLQEKNARYGNSALEPLEGVKYAAEDGIKIRISDKLKRVINSDELRKNDMADILGYLTLLCVDKDFTNFDDLID